jgi:hypothetical protein
VNRDLGRKSFDQKKAVYATSDLEITRSVAKSPKWDRQAIEHRQAHMAKLAVNIWRFQ